jgi:hypothetical protein
VGSQPVLVQQVANINDGPVTFLLDSSRLF